MDLDQVANVGLASVHRNESKHRNFSFAEYTGRLAWRICWLTLWKLLWRRIYALRPFLLKAFGAKVSWRNLIFGSTWVEIPWNLSLGEYSTLGPRVTVYNLGKIFIGRNTTISQDAYLCAGTHDYTDPTMPLIKTEIIIGDSVWICAGAFIGPGVKVGDGVVVGARAVVVKDVEPWTVVAGNPARVVKKRFLRTP